MSLCYTVPFNNTFGHKNIVIGTLCFQGKTSVACEFYLEYP